MMFTAIAVDLGNRMAELRNARSDRGAAMAEYGLLLALVALAAIAILVAFGGEIREVFTEAEETINNRGDIPEAD